MKRRNLGWLLLGILAPNMAWAESKLNLTKGVTEISNDVYGMHMLALYICTAIGIVVFGAMIWSMIFHRKSRGVTPATFHESTKVEILWTVIPIVILIAMAWPATNTLIAMENNDNSDITIQVTGSQWKWHYKYFDQDIEFYSVLATPRTQFDNREGNAENKGQHYLLEVDKPLVIPTNKKVRFLITSDDVIHSWWVPAFAVKQDANPGFINEAWTNVSEPGIYRGQCAELCGKDHGYMPIVVEVKSEQDYAAWLDEQHRIKEEAAAAEAASLNASLSLDELMKEGEKTYLAHCAACHQPGGTGLPPAFPALKGSKIALGEVNAHIDIVFNGKAGTGMQGYGKQLSLKEIAAVVTYERNAWGNNTGDAVQAADVQTATSGSASAPAVMDTSAEQTNNTQLEAQEEDLSKTYTLDELMTKGEQVYTRACAACHQPTGAGLAPAFPSLIGSPIITGDVAAHIDIVVNGSKKNPAMAAFGTQLSKTDIAAVITYERNAWGNNSGDLVQPADVDAASAK
ncbi:cytochrome c oxidase subunit 2 [Thalassotalea marina]|uniref:Cytochrome c oxidase subunit 2 n=2 Tax=Thalassotalea marina TaxID=1673741 RepID=A0A919BM54_9GAMM|nr:cytochrome c oxidase subunit 2 [Thalassotalea marina]